MTSHRATALSHAGTVIVAVPPAAHVTAVSVLTTAHIAASGTSAATVTTAAATALTTAAGQQQKDNQTIHTLCFLSMFVTLSYAAKAPL